MTSRSTAETSGDHGGGSRPATAGARTTAGGWTPATDAQQALPGSTGLGERLYPLLGIGGYDVQDDNLRVLYPWKDPKQTVTGTGTVTAVAAQNLARFTRDGDEPVITPKPTEAGQALLGHRQ